MNFLEKLLPRHYAILELCLAGMDKKAIAEKLEITPQTVYNVTNSPLFQDELARRKKSVEAKQDSLLASTPARAKAVLDQNAVRAAERLSQLVQSADEGIAHRSSVAILDKVLGSDQSKIRPITINVEQLENLQVALLESRNLQKEAS